VIAQKLRNQQQIVFPEDYDSCSDDNSEDCEDETPEDIDEDEFELMCEQV
jgi:hypothetical protein